MGEPGEDLGATFARLRQTLHSYLRRQVRDPALVDDLLQEVFLKAIESSRAQRPLANPTAWLYAVARTSVADHCRAARAPSEELTEDIPNPEIDDQRLRQELATCLRPLAQQLPAIYRDTILATDFNGATMPSLAARQGLSVSAIKSRAARARAMLREQLLACCEVELSAGAVVDFRRRSARACAGKCA